jgi:RIO kinase 1
MDEKGHVGNKAYNSFRQSMHRKINKGVAAHGHGRANAYTDRTRGGAMDPKVRLVITKAIKNGIINVCNGVVKEGKEALVYHATTEGTQNSSGYDVAVKVFKRIQEFKQRGLYVDGDPRYHGKQFGAAGAREQLELWAEKEHRNLARANRAGVPVPTPLFQKENVLFMRFLGDDCWPSPQLKELEMKRGSKKWNVLYTQKMASIRR